MYYKENCTCIVCDNCQETFQDYHSGYSMFTDENQAHEYADNNEWHLSDKHYCPDCFTVDDEDVLHVETSRTKPVAIPIDKAVEPEHIADTGKMVKEVDFMEDVQSHLQERILCAAIWWDDGKKHEHQPKNIESGVIICGRRHHNCYSILEGITGTINGKLLVKGREAQGFITSHDRYVNRMEGYKIAKAANQIIHNYHGSDNPILCSEDLY